MEEFMSGYLARVKNIKRFATLSTDEAKSIIQSGVRAVIEQDKIITDLRTRLFAAEVKLKDLEIELQGEKDNAECLAKIAMQQKARLAGAKEICQECYELLQTNLEFNRGKVSAMLKALLSPIPAPDAEYVTVRREDIKTALIVVDDEGNYGGTTWYRRLKAALEGDKP